MGAGHFHQTPEGRRRDRAAKKGGDAIAKLLTGIVKDSAKAIKKAKKK